MDLFKKFVGGNARSAQTPLPAVEDDFADFAAPPDPSPASLTAAAAAAPTSHTLSSSAIPTPSAIPIYRPYTKWYRVWERVYITDFYAEFFIIPMLVMLVFVHLWGMRKNRRKARAWFSTHGPVLKQEFASVGFSGRETPNISFDAPDGSISPLIMREKSANEFISYASGRQNVASVDIKLTMKKRYNPMARVGEEVVAFFIESVPVPVERMEAISYVFDGKETDMVALLQGPEGAAQKKEKFNSAYDGFVWAVVHKDVMQTLRDGRYDLSLTATKDHPKLPTWATVMSESAEITETLLTPQLIQAINQAGEALETLIITDQPIDQPQKLNDAIPKKRVSVSIRLPQGTDAASYEPTVPLFSYFLRLPDLLASTAHFRPEVMRRVRATREEEIRKIKKVDETEKAEERRTKNEKEKKKERDDKLRALNPEEQRKFLEKERAQDLRKSQKGRTVRA